LLEVAEEARGGGFIRGHELVDEEDTHFFFTVLGSRLFGFRARRGAEEGETRRRR
jgi:hypothetical protein